MRLIDADALVWKIKTEKGGTPAMLVAVNSIPTVDAVPVVRCYECKHLYVDYGCSIGCGLCIKDSRKPIV